MRLRDLPADVPVARPVGDGDVDITSVAYDSRRVEVGALFCCLVGASSDGHDHASQAVASGAVALLVERSVGLGVPEIRVPSAREAIGPISDAVYGRPSSQLRVMGVTGTNGKTTTTYMLDAIARAENRRTGLVGTVETHIGDAVVPQPLTTPEAPELQALLARMLNAGVTSVAMEVSSIALDMKRVRGTRFASVGFTNLGHDHLDYHVTVEAYLAAKASLFTPEYAGSAAVNLDDAVGPELGSRARDLGVDVVTFGLGTEAEIGAEDVELTAEGSSLRLVDRRSGRAANVRSPLVGAFNVANLVAAAAVALTAGVDWRDTVAGLGASILVPGRMERIHDPVGAAVFVDYAHTPDALDSVLATARTIADAARLSVVLGAGGDRDRAKRPLMGAVAARWADRVVVTNDNPRSEHPGAIADAIVDGVRNEAPSVVVERELDRRHAIQSALAQRRPGDVIVIAGKGHETGQTAGGVTVPFDDREVTRAALEAQPCG